MKVIFEFVVKLKILICSCLAQRIILSNCRYKDKVMMHSMLRYFIIQQSAGDFRCKLGPVST